jgi:DNA-binding MurR/RpiR family transcriptional regulator
MDVATLVTASRESLAPAERRVAEHLLADPQSVAFGTVATLAEATRTSGATVVRLASKLGFDGFSSLQARVRDNLASQLRPAVERIHAPVPGDIVDQVLAAETRNVHATLSSLDRADFERAVRRLAEAPGRVLVAAGECVNGVGELLVSHLDMLRPGVGMLAGNDQRIGRTLADLSDRDTVIVIDFRRYDRWVLAAARQVRESGGFLVSCVDSPLSRLAELADLVFTVSAAGTGPFDSYVACLSLVNALVAGVAGRLTPAAATRLERIEANWRALGALLEEPR